MQRDITKLVLEAQADSRKMNELIEDFLPFIKNTANAAAFGQSKDDALTLAMLAFMDCVRTYSSERGSFISFAQTCIRNRLIDDFRAQRRHDNRALPLAADDATARDWEAQLSLERYQRQLQKAALCDEIADISGILESWNTSFAELCKICPKQKRTRAQCEYIAALILKNAAWRSKLLEKHTMPGKEMCEAYGVSKKIIEKYRKYIAVLCIIQCGDYPALRAFIPVNRKGGL